uniref:Ragulator complex protein LAMTOR1 n=1 Tax=Periophthalmus magnuspinnatus TaxID=409849 RepID=A0A3B4BBH7_9GOBI
MGCCYSSEDKPLEEVKPLMPPSNTVSKSPNGTDWTTPSVPSARTDEQALLTSILTKTAQNIIDVSAADQHMMEPHEYMDRARQYSHHTPQQKP